MAITARRLEIRSRRELLRDTHSVVWNQSELTAVVVKNPALDVRSAWDEICEKLHVDGVELEVEERDGELVAVFRAQYAPRRPSTAGSVFTRIEMSSQSDQFSR